MEKDYEMIDGEKIFKALKLGKVTGLGCTLTSAECDYLIAHDDVLTQYITLLENDQLMNQRIAELEAQQRWIPVSERLPDNWESVLTIDISKSTQDVVTAFYNPEISLWATHFSCDLWVTHWMPLPVPPIMYGKESEE